MRSSKSGLTLVEVLVVLAIIGVLAALIFPSLKRYTESAKVTKCLANIKQLGHGIMLFAADHNGALPPSEEGATPGGGAYPGPTYGKVVAASAPTWAEYIFKTYLDNDPRALQCPSKPVTWKNLSRGNAPDYGFNQRLSPLNSGTGYREGMRLATLTRQSEIILLGESGFPSGLDAKQGYYRILSSADLHPRHANSTVNVLYLDQHAETYHLDPRATLSNDEPLGRNQFVP